MTEYNLIATTTFVALVPRADMVWVLETKDAPSNTYFEIIVRPQSSDHNFCDAVGRALPGPTGDFAVSVYVSEGKVAELRKLRKSDRAQIHFCMNGYDITHFQITEIGC